jgi:alpha-1,3-rhamnosyltransferase
MKPHVSVIVTTYNHGPYIGAALQSVLDQDYADREIIVVDDESTDDTAARVAEFDGKVVSLRQNQGPAGARNTGIRHAW